MRLLVFVILFFTFLALSCNGNFESRFSSNLKSIQKNISAQVVYGADNRLDVHEISDVKLLQLERSVAGIMFKNKVLKRPNGRYSISTKDYGNFNKLCKDEKFYNQKSSSHCTGFLIGQDTLATAGHCVDNQSTCDNLNFVFGLSQYQNDAKPNYNNVSANNIYSCKELVHTTFSPFSGPDFAIVKLDRKVKGRKPLKIRTYGKPNLGTETVLIGKPKGLPTKIAKDSQITKHGDYTFTTDSDAFKGNSGSPVFNLKSGIVEGILVKGARDFVYNSRKKCNETNRCRRIGVNKDCLGEGSQYITHILPYFNEVSSQQLYENKISYNIPDNEPRGVSSEINIDQLNIVVSELTVHIDIKHSWTGDLKIILKSPNQKETILFNNPGEYGEDLVLSYGSTKKEQEILEDLSIPLLAGTWTLQIIDEYTRDEGILNSWAIEIK